MWILSWIFENAPGWNFNHVPLKMKANRTWNNISDKNVFTPFPPKWRFHLTTEVIRHAAGKLILQVLTLPLWPRSFLFCFVLFRSSMFVSFVLFFIGGHTESPWGRFQWIILTATCIFTHGSWLVSYQCHSWLHTSEKCGYQSVFTLFDRTMGSSPQPEIWSSYYMPIKIVMRKAEKHYFS